MISGTTDGLSDKQSATLYRRMMVGKIMRYRWYDWPNNDEHSGVIDLTNFRSVAALMEALFDQFETEQVLHPR